VKGTNGFDVPYESKSLEGGTDVGGLGRSPLLTLSINSAISFSKPVEENVLDAAYIRGDSAYTGMGSRKSQILFWKD